MWRERQEECLVGGRRGGSSLPQLTSTHTIQIHMLVRLLSPRRKGGLRHGIYIYTHTHAHKIAISGLNTPLVVKVSSVLLWYYIFLCVNLALMYSSTFKCPSVIFV